MNRLRLKWLTLVLVFSVTFLGFTPQILLAALIQSQNHASSSSEDSRYRHKDIQRLLELEDKRDKHTKHYLNSDGSYTAESTISSRHYKDDQGKWQDISNRIVSSEESGYALRNEANAFQTHFAQNSMPNFLVKIKMGTAYEIMWKMDQAQKTDAVHTDYSVTYPNILPSTDLEYLPYSDGLKENIILKDSTAANAFRFTFQLKGLTPSLQEDQSIALNDEKTGETEFVIPSAFMMDQKQAMSHEVKLILTPTNNPNEFTLDLLADRAWLDNPERAYPIVIDPNITTDVKSVEVGTNGSDTYVALGSPYQYYNNTYMSTGWDSTYGATRSYVKFPLPTLPTGAIVTDGLFSIYKYTQTSATAEDLVAARVKTDWSALNLTWSNQPQVDTANEVTQPSLVPVSGSYTGWVDFNIWTIAKGWFNGGLPNYGLMVRHNNEENPLFFYYTSNNGTLQPKLTVTYITDQIGLNSYWGYANTSIGSVNTYNGNFITSVSDFALPGRGIPINVTRTYNSRGNVQGIFGKTWFSNLDMQLAFYSWGALLIDGVGTERPFMKKADGSYTGPDNYPVQLYKNADGTYTLQEKSEYPGIQPALPRVNFDAQGKLIQLLDGKGNTTQITRTIGSITLKDASGRSVLLTLNTADGTVQSIQDHTSQLKTEYAYSNGYLTQVTYKNSTTGDSKIQYTWDNGLLRSLKDKNGTPYFLTYDSSKRVASIGEMNLLGNPSLEAGYGSNLDSWDETIVADYGSITKDASQASTGKNSVHLQSSSTVYPNSNMSFLYVQQKVPVKPSTTYTFSAKAKTSNLNGRAFLNTVELDSSGTAISSTWKDTRANAFTGTKDWAQQSLTLTTGANTAYLTVYLEIDHDNTHWGGDAYFDEAQLIEGSSPTAFYGHTEIGFGSDTWITSPLGDVNQYQHNNYGNPMAIIGDPGGLNAATLLAWNSADQLKQLTTPLGSTYTYSYDALGNMTLAKDPRNYDTKFDYTLNHLKTLTQPDGKTVQNVWEPLRLNNVTHTDQAGNSKAYAYESGTGNLAQESNWLGIADNRIYNSGFSEVDANNQPTDWIAFTPTGSTASVIDDPTAPYGGGSVLSINSGTNHNAYQRTGFINVTDKANGNYILSVDMKVTESGTTLGSKILIKWFDINKAELGEPISYIKGEGETWQRYITTDINPPNGAMYAQIFAISYQGSIGSFDNIQFEQSPQIRGYNALKNSSFVNGSSQWILDSSYATVTSQMGQINLPSQGSTHLESQTLLPIRQNQEYTLSGNIKTETMVASPGTGAWLEVEIYDGAGVSKGSYLTEVIYQNQDWTKQVVSFKSPINGTAKVRLKMYNAQGKASFDNIRFSPGRSVVNYGYDTNKNYLTQTTNQLGNTVIYEPDAYGQSKSVTSPSGEKIQYSYDGEERLQSVTDNAGNVTTYTLDPNGNVLGVKMTAPDSGVYNQSSFVYDEKNNLKVEKGENGNTVSEYFYDLVGRLTQKKNATGSTVNLTYDPLGRLKELLFKRSDNANEKSYKYDYDVEGRRTQSQSLDKDGNVLHEMNYSYDSVGNLTGSVEKIRNNQVGEINGVTYSKNDELTNFSLKVGTETGTAIPYAFTYTPNKLVDTVTSANKNFTFKYDEGSRLKSQLNVNNVKDQFVYNEAGQLIETIGVKPDGKKGWGSQYQYDADGRLNKVIGSQSPSAEYVYNNETEKLNRLTKATITDGSTSYVFDYSYDPAENILSMSLPNGQINTFTYDGDNKVSTINGNAGAVSYDVNGNLTKLTVNGKTQEYVYDAANRLEKVLNASGTEIVSYTYDGDGKRLTKTTGKGTPDEETISYHYFQGQLLYETSNKDSADTIRVRYIRTPEGKLLGVIFNNTEYTYHYNAHGDVEKVTDVNGAVFRQYVYDPYGNIISLKDGAGNSVDINNDTGFNHAYTYAGYRYDKETGLYFLNARYYAPEIGRLLTKDFYIGKKENPKSLNAYAYVQGDPINNIDPGGEITIALGGLLAVPVVGEVMAVGAVLFIAVGLTVYLGTLVYDLVTGSANEPQSIPTSSGNLIPASPNGPSDDTISSPKSKPRSAEPPAKRKRYPTKKEAYDAAKKAGKGLEPILHPKGKYGPHYHPNVPEVKGPRTPKISDPHDHYYFPRKWL